MKNHIREFCRRGIAACGFGPIVLAVLYLILHDQGAIGFLTVDQVCLGIFSLTVLAFVAGGMNAIYQIEQLPMMAAVFLHGIVLYISYLITYLINGWIKWGITPVLVFSVIFIGCYLVIWAIIYFVTKRRTDRINEILKNKKQEVEETFR